MKISIFLEDPFVSPYFYHFVARGDEKLFSKVFTYIEGFDFWNEVGIHHEFTLLFIWKQLHLQGAQPNAHRLPIRRDYELELL